MSHSETSRVISHLIEKNMRKMGIVPYPQRVQEEMFQRLKEEAKQQDDFFNRYNKPSARRIFRNKIIDLHEEGLKTDEIADRMKVTPSIIFDELRKAGYVRRKSKDEHTVSTNTNQNINQSPKLPDKARAKAGKKKSTARA